MKKLLRIGAVLLVLLAVAVAVVLLVDFDSPRLGRALLAKVSQEAGVRIEAERFRLNLLKGFRLGEIRFETAGPSGRLTATAAELDLKHRLIPLLKGRIEIDRVALYQPRLELVTPVETRAAAAKAVPAPGTGGGSPVYAVPAVQEGGPDLDLRIDRISIQDGALATRTESAPAADVEIRGLDAEVRGVALLPGAPTTIQAFRAGGDFKAREIVSGTLRGTEVQGRIALADGHLRLEEVRSKLAEGLFLLSELDVDLNRDPFAYRLASRVDPLDTNLVLGAGEQGGFGLGRLAFQGAGTGTETRDLDGQGTLAVAAGRLPHSPVFKALETALGRTALRGSAYDPFEVRFRLRDDRLAFDPFELKTSTVAFRVSGAVDLAGPLHLKVAVRAPREMLALARVPPRLLDLMSRDGRVDIPLTVTGTPEAPRVAVDTGALRDTGRTAVRQELGSRVRQGARRLFGKIFRRRGTG
ncbi:MAG TPA: AsmA family protein [Thermoanaerobaculia bacterium]|jgi:hypothetical protein